MSEMNGKTDHQINDNSNSQQFSPNSEDLDENQMQKTLNFGRKKLFGRRTDSSEASFKGTDSQPQVNKRAINRWPNLTSSASNNQLANNSSNNKTQNSSNTNSNHKSNGLAPTSDLLNEDKFYGDGIQFSAKLIGHEFVAEARGEHMCQQSIKKLKILQRGLGGHKRKVLIFISFDGIKIRDALTSELIYHHSVPQISFISRDETDSRAFGYVFGSSTTGHQFIALKTQKEAMPIMSAIGQLFAVTLKRKKSEIIGESVTNTGAVNEEKTRRESSATLRPSRSESPNVPSMPAPPPPLLTKSSTSSTAPAEELDFFSAFEPMDSVFESDFKVNKEKLDQMPMTGGSGIEADPFASSFGSLSMSSGDWANFDEDNLSASASSHNNSITANTSKPLVISLQNNFGPKAQLASSFNDSSSSMALNQLFNTSGNHNQLNNSSNFSPNIVNSEAVAIPPRPLDRENSQQFQSVGSTTSSTDRYACFAEIHSISSSIFDSMCDQIADEVNGQTSSKSLNSSLNGGFGGVQHQLSSSLNTTGNSFYYSFDNPLNSEQQKHNFLFSQTSNNSKQINSQKFDTNFTQNTNEINAQNVWNNNSFNTNNNITNTNQSSNVWSTSSSMSGNSSQVSGTSSPNPPSVAAPTPPPQPNPMSTTGFGMNRSNDMLAEVVPVFAELDPLGKDRPFVDRSQFFAEQKQKPTLRSLNTEPTNTNPSFGTNSPTFYSQTNDSSINQTTTTKPIDTNQSSDNKFGAISNTSSNDMFSFD